MSGDLGRRTEAALGELLQRRVRADLYGDLTDGIGHGVDPTTYPVISGIARLGPITAARLAAEVGIDRSVASRYASRLEEHGLIRRGRDKHDRRAVLLTLTPRGQEIVGLMRGRLVALLDERLAAWPPDQAEAFVAGLERFVAQTLGDVP
ncbi:MarR family transcriptional regulator [Nocardiopsis gilva YIM 90087]|uniref:MarR family transcriptional regulator n=1 Tax=Nocardiopsis gilva YIM 90087 TaxID=1235441 RepID=A0A223SBX7_9ACTN|nr:MarR family winged helix-turn-helix transcriptional regulator [Nocardiopsis gilva]ASU85586.1 MarR family transcriptional regulator [Nocardiopsis gilva YIM 90087]